MSVRAIKENCYFCALVRVIITCFVHCSFSSENDFILMPTDSQKHIRWDGKKGRLGNFFQLYNPRRSAIVMSSIKMKSSLIEKLLAPAKEDQLDVAFFTAEIIIQFDMVKMEKINRFRTSSYCVCVIYENAQIFRRHLIDF